MVVYSAFPERQEFEHGLVVEVEKGRDSDEKVARALEGFRTQAEVIRSVHADFDARIREALHDSVYSLSEQPGATSGDPGDTSLARAVRRLVAARTDRSASGEGRLKAWERFVIPPLGDDLLTADLLRRPSADWRDEEAFRLVLTPSCDLVRSGGRTPRADRILVARCERLRKLGTVEIKSGQALNSKQRGRVRPVLTEGMDGTRLPIPRFQGQVPPMAANLKRLDLIEWSDVKTNGRDGSTTEGRAKFVRVASTDSPFREMVVWAYLRVTGRPGVPGFHADEWLDDISEWNKKAEQ